MGCLEALHLLSTRYPPVCVPSEWECSQQPFTVIEIFSELIKSSRLAWGVQGWSSCESVVCVLITVV